MSPLPDGIWIDQAHSTYWLLATLACLALLLALLLATGYLQSWLGRVTHAIAAGIQLGFQIWELTLAWARWPVYLILVIILLVVGIHCLLTGREWASLLISVVLLVAGASACTAFMFVSLERYDVARGYKAVHNPAKGQELARHVAYYGDRLEPLMLAISGVATIAAFALLNASLYRVGLHSWYSIRDPNGHPGYLDFLAFSLIHLLSVVDVLDLLQTSHLVTISFVRKGAWPVAMLLVAFKSFFTVVLVQQVAAAFREQRLLWEMISDFWSPHAPIHERARIRLSQFGPASVGPLVRSLATAEALTREQRDEFPAAVADLGPLAIPELMKYLGHEREIVRGIAAAALGRLGAVDALPHLLKLRSDSNETVRAYVVDALGAVGETYVSPAQSAGQRYSFKKGYRVVAVWRTTRRLSFRLAWLIWSGCRRLAGKGNSDRSVNEDIVAACCEALSASLADPAPAVRLQAMKSLSRMADRAASAAGELLVFLKSGTDQERLEAAVTLGKLQAKDSRVLSALSEALADPVIGVRSAAATALGNYGVEAADHVAALIALLDDPQEEIRDAATAAIQQIGVLDTDARQVLQERLVHPDTMTRAQTVEALGEMGEAAQHAAPALVDSLQDENDLVRVKAAEALGRIGEAAAEVAVPALTESLEDADSLVQARAAEALGQMGPQGLAALPNLLELLRTGNVEVRGQAAESLGQLGAIEARADLEAASADEDAHIRERAVQALGALRQLTDSTQLVLLRCLSDPTPAVRAAAVESLAACQAPTEAVIGPIVALLHDDSAEVVVKTMEVLPRFGSEALGPAFEALCGRLTDDADPQMTAAAADALGRFDAAGRAAGPALARVAQTAHASARRAALRALARTVPPEAPAAFTAGLYDADPEVRRQASAGFFRVRELPESQQDLLEALTDPDRRIRTNIATTLGRYPALPVEAESLLLGCAADSHAGLRRAAAKPLAAIHSPKCLDALRHLLEDPVSKVRQAATAALAGIPVAGEDSARVDEAEGKDLPVVILLEPAR